MNVLWIPIFSMRSYETGKYSILKDGNFQLTLARALASQYERVFLAVPEDAADYDEFAAKYSSVESKLYIIKLKYGANAVETREQFWQLNAEFFDRFEQIHVRTAGRGLLLFDRLITDITGYAGSLPVIYNFNITKLPELDRPYIDKFWDQDIESIRQSLFTTVINPRQKEYIVEQFPELESKVKVHLKVAHEDLLPHPIVSFYPPKTIFWPFRISDKAYQWEEFLTAVIDQGLDKAGWTIVCTDPNDTLKDTPAFVYKLKPTKEEYYATLAMKPIVVMLDDIDTVLHPGTIEIMYYGCPVVTYESNLISNPNSIRDLKELREALDGVEYNAVDVADFVYKHNEKDDLHK